MNNATIEKTTYAIHGFYFQPDGQMTLDTHFHYSDGDSMIDHQKSWYNEALKLGYNSGDLDEASIIKTNYRGALTDEQVLAIVNDSKLMSTPFGELFSRKIAKYVVELLESEYADTETYVLENESNNNCSEELSRLNAIQNEIAQLTFHRC